MTARGPETIVVGAGIVGASIAWHLARAGAPVTLLDAGAAGGVATPNSFAWINSNPSFGRGYFELRHRSMAEWRRLADDLPGLPVALCGALYLPAPNIDLPKFVAQHQDWGYRIRLVERSELQELEPALAIRVDVAAYALDEGAAEPDDTARALAAAAVDAGAVLRQGVAVEGLVIAGGGVAGVRIGGETLTADEVVIAAGVATPALLADSGFDLPLKSPAGLLAHTAPAPRLVHGVVLGPDVHIRQKPDGALVAGADFQGGALEDDPESGAGELMRRLAETIYLHEPLALDRATLGYRPTPADGHPVVGRPPDIDGLTVAVTHSGVTLAPVIGLLVAHEIVSGHRHPLLRPYGPDRFAKTATVRSARAASGGEATR